MGIVNKVFFSYIGCLVYGCFNVFIFKFEQLLVEQWLIMEINMGDELEFEVFCLDLDVVGVFCIWGKLNIISL